MSSEEVSAGSSPAGSSHELSAAAASSGLLSCEVSSVLSLAAVSSGLFPAAAQETKERQRIEAVNIVSNFFIYSPFRLAGGGCRGHV